MSDLETDEESVGIRVRRVEERPAWIAMRLLLQRNDDNPESELELPDNANNAPRNQQAPVVPINQQDMIDPFHEPEVIVLDDDDEPVERNNGVEPVQRADSDEEVEDGEDDHHDNQCATCRIYPTVFLEQQNDSYPYLTGSLRIKVSRILYLSKDLAFHGRTAQDRLELAIIDFVCRDQYASKYNLNTLIPLGFKCQVRLRGTTGRARNDMYIARALIGYAPFPTHEVNWTELMEEVGMYSGGVFGEFNMVTCLDTIQMLLTTMARGFVEQDLTPFYGY